MPPIFKALATITVWVLFVGGCVGVLGTTISFWVNVGILAPAPLAYTAGWGVSSGGLILAVVAIKLRQMLE